MSRGSSSDLWSELAAVAREAKSSCAPVHPDALGKPPGTPVAFANMEQELPVDVASIMAGGHAKVIDHYRRLLKNPGVTPSERADIEARLRDEERAVLGWKAT
jgi:hypothetical protein